MVLYALSIRALFQKGALIWEKTVRPNTHRNYRERYLRNIDPVIGKMKLKDVKPFACQQIMNRMAEQKCTSSTIYQARIALFNMFDYAVQNDVIIKNPCNKTVKANIGKEVSKKEALTIEQQKKFLYGIKGNAYENQYAFLLQTGRPVSALLCSRIKASTSILSRLFGTYGRWNISAHRG